MSTSNNTQADIDAAFTKAQSDVKEAEACQPGDYLVHSNDVQGILNTLHSRVYQLLGIEEDA